MFTKNILFGGWEGGVQIIKPFFSLLSCFISKTLHMKQAVRFWFWASVNDTLIESIKSEPPNSIPFQEMFVFCQHIPGMPGYFQWNVKVSASICIIWNKMGIGHKV